MLQELRPFAVDFFVSRLAVTVRGSRALVSSNDRLVWLVEWLMIYSYPVLSGNESMWKYMYLNLNQSFRIDVSSLCPVFWDDFIFIIFRNRLTFHIGAYFDFALINSLTEKNTLENENKKINIFSSSYLSIMETVFYFFKEGSYTTSYYLKLRNSSSNHAWFKIYPNIPFSKIRKFCSCLNSWRHHGHIKSHRTHLFIYLFIYCF